MPSKNTTNTACRKKKKNTWYVRCNNNVLRKESSSIIGKALQFLMWDRLRHLNPEQREMWDSSKDIDATLNQDPSSVGNLVLGENAGQISEWLVTDSSSLLSSGVGEENRGYMALLRGLTDAGEPVADVYFPQLVHLRGNKKPPIFEALFYKKTVPHPNKLYPRSDHISRCLARLITEAPYQAGPTEHQICVASGPISSVVLTTQENLMEDGTVQRLTLVSHLVYRIGHWMLKYCTNFMTCLDEASKRTDVVNSPKDPFVLGAVPRHVFNWFVTYYHVWSKHVGRRSPNKEIITPVQSYLINDQFHYRDVGLMAIILEDLDRDPRGFMVAASTLMRDRSVIFCENLNKKLAILVACKMRILLQNAEATRP